MNLNGKRIILGSKSPRRRELLAGLNIPFEIDAATLFDEDSAAPGCNPADIPARMSEGKSLGFHRPLADDEILITSDTLVFCDGLVLGKPHSREDAILMLHMLSGNVHTVITAVTIRSNSRTDTFTDEAKVFFNKLTDEEIVYYVDNFKPFDKAGSYGVQEWIGYVGISKIEGSFYTVMGLPVALLYQHLLPFLK